MGHDLDGGWKRNVSAHMVTVAVGVDQRRNRIARQRPDRVEDRLTPARVLGIDNHHASRRHEDSRVTSAPLSSQHEKVVSYLIDLDVHLALLPGHTNYRERAH